MDKRLALKVFGGLTFCLMIAGCFEPVDDCTRGTYNDDALVTSPDDLRGYEAIAGDLDVRDCDECRSLSNLICLASVGGTVDIHGNDALLRFSGLYGIEALHRDFFIEDNAALLELYGMRRLGSVQGTLRISHNASLKTVRGLEELRSVGGTLSIEGNSDLADLNGLSSVTEVGAVEIRNNPFLPDCEVCGLLQQLAIGPDSMDVHDNLADTCTPVPENCP